MELVFINVAYMLMFGAYALKEVLYLRIVVIIASMFFITYAAMTGHTSIFWWNSAFLVINLYQAIVILKSRRPVKLMPETEEIYKKSFKFMSRRSFLYFWQTGERKKIEDKCILKTGDKTSDLFYIISGRVHLSRNGEKVAELEGGDFIAEPALFPEKNVKIDACASGDVEYRVFTADVLDSLSRLNPAIYSKVSRILGRYMTATLRNALGKEGFNKISEN